jgi:hypothetical protein
MLKEVLKNSFSKASEESCSLLLLASGFRLFTARYGQFLGIGELEPDGWPPGLASPARLKELEIGNNFQLLHARRQACRDKAPPIPDIACRRQPDLTS